MAPTTLYLWKKVPFLRIIIPFIAGIIIQWYGQIAIQIAYTLFAISITGLILFNFRLHFVQLTFNWINGILMNAMLISLGVFITYTKDITHQKKWFNNIYKENSSIVVTIEEPLSEKEKSFKANASINEVINEGVSYTVKGNVILYFEKDSFLQPLKYGNVIILKKTLQNIRSLKNPAAFNYQQYAAFQNVHHQIYLNAKDFSVLPDNKGTVFKAFLLQVKEKIVFILRTYIDGEKEAGLAEALLIGYKDDLDKRLLQSYSNTGVIHVIAISGLHLGLIYWLLSLLCKPLQKSKHTQWLIPFFIIIGLWLFALLAGASPSILRAAVMFSCIAIGQGIERKTNIYNALAASAFILLCINPFWLWDAGFQLSYMAVLSIVIFRRPIYNWFYFENKIIDAIWKLNAITLAAQILTVPICIYQFHQFPNYFLLTNMLAVPLSSFIVLSEIILCATAFIPAVAKILGFFLHIIIYAMNSFIEHMEKLPFSLWNNLQINFVQLALLYGVIIGICYWLIKKNSVAFLTAITCLLIFVCFRTTSFIIARQQQKLIVYNVPQHQAIDFISGRNYFYTGDTLLCNNTVLENFYLTPSHIFNRVNRTNSLNTLFAIKNGFIFNNKRVIIIDKPYKYDDVTNSIETDVLIISKNPNISIKNFLHFFSFKQLIFDASNDNWEVNKWKADCQELGLAYHYVVDKGAFVVNMD